MLIGIVADDLTGAADAAAPFANRHLSCVTLFSPQVSTSELAARTDVVSYTTDTRDDKHSNPTRMASQVRRAARRVRDANPRLIYKKIDSTLRGHLRLELDAMRRELPERFAVICPAFPANGRIVENGRLFINGVAWEASEFAPSAPPPSDPDFNLPSVRSAFEYGKHDSALLPRSLLAEGAARGHATLLRLQKDGIQAVLCDAATNEDLDILAQAIMREPERFLPVGSAGLAAALARQIPMGNVTPEVGLKEAFTQRRVLVIVGSQHAASRAQSAYLAHHIGCAPVLLDVQPDAPHRRLSSQSILHGFKQGQRIVLLTTPDVSLPEPTQMRLQIAPFRLAQDLWDEAEFPVQSLVFAGGHTARQFCRNLNAQGFTICGEIQPGVVYGRLIADEKGSQQFDGLPIITKAGGFGDEMTLARCVGLA